MLKLDWLSLLIALGLGAVIGLERELSDKAAGLRTNILICLGSCLFTVVSRELFGMSDAHITGQIVAGVGFLGAGSIMRDGEHVTGLTTAATIWVVAAIGLAAGYQRYSLAAGTTILVLVVQIAFPRLDALIDDLRRRHIFRITADFDDEVLEQIKAVFRDSGLEIIDHKIMKKDGLYYGECHVTGPRRRQKEVARRLLENARIRELRY
ncbi:MAG: MgtC/SapB family protein [Elusimicrobia bacterium]|nr:MgtC/SapB family protein [Elusimicrobiota bacterium]